MATTAKRRYYWCNTCKGWVPTTEGQWYFNCENCGELIQCGECGEAWTNGHDKEHPA